MRKAHLKEEGGSSRVLFRCQACGGKIHVVILSDINPGGDRWSWNGDVHSPTIEGSVAVQGYEWPRNGTKADQDECDKILKKGAQAIWSSRFGTMCHSKVFDGQIFYYEDSTHAYKGQTLRMLDYDK